MPWVRSCMLVSLVASILVGFSFVNRPEESMVERLLGAQARVAEALQEVASTPADAAIPAPTATPTDTPTVPPADAPAPVATATDAALPVIGADTPVALTTDTPTSTPADLATVTDTATPASIPTQSPTPTATSSIGSTPTATPPVDASLPPLADLPDEPGAVKETLISTAGGRISSVDGRVTIDVPADAFSEALDIKITRRDSEEMTRPSPDRPFVGVWDFDATSPTTKDKVHKFAKPLKITVRFSAEEMAGLDARNLVFWTLDEATGKWLPMPAQVDAINATMVIDSDHFSTESATASEMINTAPLLDGKNVDLHAGAASFGVPLQLPPGRGGLTPQLDLTYSSARLGEMRTYAAGTSWVGAGWDLDVPNIQFSQDADFTPGTPQRHRAFLSIGSIGGELLQDPGSVQDGDGFVWRLRDEQYLKIRSSCEYIGCENGWTVWDQSGTKYVFGGGTASASNFRRVYRTFNPDGPGTAVRDYRADVQYIEDAQGNRIDFSYGQLRLPDPLSPSTTYVMAAYPSQISYNGGEAIINFHRGCDETPTSPTVCMRFDTPRDVINGCGSYFAPLVLETQRLNQIEVKVSNTLVRRYDFTYQTDPFVTAGCPRTPAQNTGTHRLLNVKMLDRNYVSYAYTTTSFQYTNKHHAFINGDDEVDGYDWPHLTRVDNAFGGVVLFTYEELGRIDSGKHWSRSVVTEERHQSGASQPDVYTTIDYGPGPDQQNHPNPLKPTTLDTFNAAYRGFNFVTEVDAAGNKVEHYFYTTSDATGGWPVEVRTGREYDTIVKDAANAQWQRSQTTWSIRTVSNVNVEPDYFVNFVYPSQSVTTLKDGTTLTTVNTFDNGISSCTLTTCFGLLTRVDDNGGVGAGDEVTTKQAYGVNLARWIFVPQYEEKLDAGHGNALLSCVGYYYDGANTRTAAPVLGLPTAVSAAISGTQAQCEGATAFTTSSNTYSVFETYGSPLKTYGNVAQASAATATAPEGQASGSAFGWIPSGVPYTSAVYDATHHVFPTSQTDLANLQTNTTYDYVIGKPLTVTQPNGNVTTMIYDALGRIDRAYDSLDVSSVPTVKYIYTWGAVPNSTEVDTRVTHYYASGKQVAVSCMDGFGREIEHRQRYQSTSMASVRTDYDAGGRKSVETAAVSDGTSAACAATPAAVTGRDRRAFQYDPLGNVTITDVWQANQTSGTHPQTVASDGGLTSTFCDENLHLTTRTRDLALRKLTVSEQSGNNADCSLGANPYQTFYQYYGGGQLASVIDAAQNVTGMYYDLAGRKTQMVDPDMGRWFYYYNAAGSLASQQDARNVTTTLAYDNAQRLTQKSYSDGTPTVSFLYDTYDTTAGPACASPATAAGRMTRMTDGAGQQFTCFDVRGSALKTRRTVDGVSYDSSATYDGLGQVIQQTYPDGDIANYAETMSGQITGLSSDVDGAGTTYAAQTLLSAATFKPWGAAATMPLGSGPTTYYTYDYRARLTNIQTGTAQNLTLTYDNASNVTSVADGSETVNYSYDQLNRLTAATGFSGGLTASYGYNAIGNMLTKQEGGSNLTLTYPASGPYSIRPHAVTSTAGSQNLTLTYDANGNLATQGGASTYTYDAENRLRVRDIAGGAYVYAYDGNGALLKRTTVGPPQTVTVRPNAQGSYSQWTASPNVPHYQNVDETVADETTYIEHATAGLNDTHVYPSANVPAGAVVDKVTLKYRWRGMGVIGALYPMYRQGGVDNIPLQGAAHWPSEGWVTDSWQLAANPVTGQYWTAADVNAGVEFGFRTYWNGWTPRVTQAWVEVTYRLPTSSTDYIGGIYEKNSDGSVKKYYQALGRTIAMRRVGIGGGQGELNYLLADHLGSAAGLLDVAGVLVPNSKQTYWPYGATRSGSLTQTDKLYTGQQQEPGDSALGLYNYKARFYSTTLGRFVSADSVVPEPSAGSLNRYSYALNSPVRYNDPDGHCVLRQKCSQDQIKIALRCAFRGDCPDKSADGITKSMMRTFSWWAIRQQSFFDWVGFFLGRNPDDGTYANRHFARELSDIRMNVPNYSPRHWMPLYWSGLGVKTGKLGKGVSAPVEIVGNPVPSRVGWINGYSFSISYIDYQITPDYELPGDLGVEVWTSEDGRPFKSRGNGGLPISYSLFDPMHNGLEGAWIRVSFSVMTVKQDGALIPPQDRSPATPPVMVW